MQESNPHSYTDTESVAPGSEINQININSLFPPELLVNVFDVLHKDIMECLPFPLPYDEGLQIFKDQPLSISMLVCRGWCDLIKTTPAYWTFVDIGALHHSTVGEQAYTVRALGSEGVENIKGRLKKAGSLPLYVTVAPEYILDFGTVLEILKEYAHRLETINIVKIPHLRDATLRQTSSEQLLQLFELPLPSLQRLHIDKFHLTPPPPEPWIGSRVEMDAPRLYYLSSHLHILLPQNPSHLTSLFISGVDTGTLQSTLTHGQVQLPNLLNLRIRDSEPGLILSALSTPLLQVLVYQSENPSTHLPEDLPEYSHLRDLQWSDVGPDSTFDLVFRRCRRLVRYANYVVDKAVELRISLLVDPPTILARPGGIDSIKWPNLQEVLFDCATYASLKALVDLVPTIKRIRTLRDPIASPMRQGGDVERERSYLYELREKVDVVVWLDPWTET